MVSLEIFRWHNPSGRTMDMETNQPITEMSTRNISWWGKGSRCVGRTTFEPSCAECLEIWEPQPPGSFRVCPGLYRELCTFTASIFTCVKASRHRLSLVMS
jgi:hypothetical protein